VVANDSIRNLSEILALPNLEGIFSQLAIEHDTAPITRQIVEVIES
jgi:ABC-2 type transport system ATP-binding protein